MPEQKQGGQRESFDTAWARLASRAIRVALTRRDVSYAQLASELVGLGVSESARSVEGKVQRGTFRFAFFLQTLSASRAEQPLIWLHAFGRDASWEQRASAVMRAELQLQPWLDWTKLARRLEEIGVSVSPDALRDQVDQGTFTAALFFQCGAVCRFESLQPFIDLSALNEAALLGSSLL